MIQLGTAYHKIGDLDKALNCLMMRLLFMQSYSKHTSIWVYFWMKMNF